MTLVVLMGLAARKPLADFLANRGFSPSTPAAILLAAGTPEAWTWRGRLDELAALALPESSGDAPGTIVVGEVVSVGAALSRPDDAAERGAASATARSR